MGSEQTLIHFSDNHPLEISAYHKTTDSPTKCSACELNPSGWICTCKKCNYLIHFQCSQIPMQIQLPFHKEHVLSLFTNLGKSRSFTCCACNEQGNGFSYSCTDCNNVSIHLLCATMPQIVTHESHDHSLDLISSPPGGTHTFRCDICQGRGDNHWLYYCKRCPFYAHLSCAAPKPTFAFSSSSTGAVKASATKETLKPTPKPTFVGSSSATVSSKATTKKNDDDGNMAKNYDSSGVDAHSGGPTTKPPTIVVDNLRVNPKSTFTGSNSTTGSNKASTEKNDADDGVGDDRNKTKRYESSGADSPLKRHGDNETKINEPGGYSSYSGSATDKPKVGGPNFSTPKPTFAGSNSSTGSSKASTKKYEDDSDDGDGDGDDDVGNKTRYGTVPGGFDAHPGGTTQNQTFPSANPSTGTSKATNSSSTPFKGNNFEAAAKFNNYDSDEDNSDNDDITDYR